MHGLETVFNHPLIRELLKKYRTIWAIDHALSLLRWDLETYMPRKGSEGRSIAISELTVLRRSLLLSDELRGLVEKLQNRMEELNDYEKGIVRVLSRWIRILSAQPEELVARLAEVTSKATTVWAEAKRRNDYNLFKPYLREIIELTRKKAEYLGYKEHPYDALLDLYEEGLTTRDVEEYFSRLIPGLRRILEKILSDEFYPRSHPLEEKSYNVEKAKEASRKLLEMLGWDWSRGRLDVSPHPFTIEMDVDDVRITTRYEGKDIRRPLYAVIHEYGHALYELQVDKRLARTPIGGGVGLGVHESQSRFWENIVGRSHWFMDILKPVIEEAIGERVDSVELYRYANIVRPDLIRVEADELTYNLHIYLRFELEKQMITGEIGVDDLPELWNNMMEELLGVRPKTYSEGVLQDIHWSHGSIGYFPTYTLGNIIAGAIRKRIMEETSLADIVSQGRLGELRAWLAEKIHRWGATYPPRELLLKTIGSYTDPQPLLEYLEWKYLKLPNELS